MNKPSFKLERIKHVKETKKHQQEKKNKTKSIKVFHTGILWQQFFQRLIIRRRFK